MNYGLGVGFGELVMCQPIFFAYMVFAQRRDK